MALTRRLTSAEEFVPWLSQRCFFGKLKRDDGVQIHEKTFKCCRPLCRLLSRKSYRVSSEERVPSSSWFWLCWFLVDGFSLRSQTFPATSGLRADERVKFWGPRLLDRQWVTDQCPSFPPRTSCLSTCFSLRSFFFHPSRHGMVSPHRLSVTKTGPSTKI